MLDQLRQQHAEFCAQRDKVQVNFQQLIGAIYACEVMIEKLSKEAMEDKHEEKSDEIA